MVKKRKHLNIGEVMECNESLFQIKPRSNPKDNERNYMRNI